MKVLLCTNTYHKITHGPAKFARLFLEYQNLVSNLEVRVLTESAAESISDKVYHLNLHYPRPLHAAGRFFRMYHYYKTAMEIRKAYPFDILLFNDAMQGLIATFLKPQDLKVVGMMNDNENLIIKNTDILKSRKHFMRFLFKIAEKWMVRKADLTLVNSNFLRIEVLSTYDKNGENVKVLYKAIDFEKWSYVGPNSIRPDNRIKIVFVKSDFLRGGLFVLMEALGLLTSHHFDLIVVGPDNVYQKNIANKCAEFANVQLVFKGPLNQNAVFELLKTSHILAIPALREALGVANIEGLAVGIPVVSTFAGGIPEVLNQGEFGWLAEPGNVEDLKNKLEDCIYLEERERNMKCERGRRYAEEKFNHVKMVKRLNEVLKDH